MRRSTSLFKASPSLRRASTFLSESLCCRSSWSWRWARRAISGRQSSCWVMSLPPERSGYAGREVVPPGAAAFRVGPKTGGRPWKTTARVDMGFRKSLD